MNENLGNTRFLVGIDGGGTGTTAVVANRTGRIVAHGLAGPANYHAAGLVACGQALQAAVMRALEAAKIAPEQVDMLFFGLAGLNSPNDEAVYRQTITGLGLGMPFEVVNDIRIAWAGATLCQPGVVMIGGTGCSAFGINSRDEEWKASGWDYILADQGSGYWIGLEGIRAVLCAYDGRGNPTKLTEALGERYNIGHPTDMLQVAYASSFGKTQIAAFARSVGECARDGDPVAQQIMEAAAHELARGATAVIRRLGMEHEHFTLGLIGGIFRSGELLMDHFTHAVLAEAPHATIEFSRFPAAVGALLAIFHRAGSLTPAVVTEIEASVSVLEEAIRWKAV